MDPSLPIARRAAAEGLAAFALVFAGCGAIVTDACTAGRSGTVGVALVFGLVIMVMVYATGHLSGRPHQSGRDGRVHPHPALPAPATRRPTSGPSSPGRVAARSACSPSGPSAPADLGRRSPPSASAARSLYEALLTAFLMFVIMAVATDTRAVGAAAAIAIGGTVGLDALFGGPGHRRIDEPGALAGPGAGRRGVGRLLDLRGGPARRGGARRARLPARARRVARQAVSARCGFIFRRPGPFLESSSRTGLGSPRSAGGAPTTTRRRR